MTRITIVFLSGAASREAGYPPATPSFQGSASLRSSRRVNLSPATSVKPPGYPKKGLARTLRKWESTHLMSPGPYKLMHLDHKLKQVQDPSPRQMVGGGAWTVPPWYSYRSIFKTAHGSHNQGRSENPWPLAAQCVVPVQPTQQLLGASWQCKPSAPSPGPQNQTPHFTRLPR